MAYTYNRAASTNVQNLPASKVINKVWNDLHDLEDSLQEAGHDYDVATSFGGKPGEKDAKRVLDSINAIRKTLRDLAGTDGSFDRLTKMEQDFAKKHGSPEDYVDEMRREVYPR